MKSIFLGPLLLLSAACTYSYETPDVSPSRAFSGILDYLDASPRGRVHVVFVHGMCSHLHDAIGSGNWVGLRASQLADAVGGNHDIEDYYELTERYYAPGNDPETKSVKRYDIPISTPAGIVDATFLVWGRHVDPYRQNLEFENTRQGADSPGAPIRAPVNSKIKTELMNRCLMDAIVYVGKNGDPIRRDMREATCDLLGGEFTPAIKPGDSQTKATCEGTEGLSDTTLLVPESLGSTIMFDAFTSLKDETSPRDKISSALGNVRSIYLASNQIALLEQGNPPAGIPRSTNGDRNSLERFMSLIGKENTRRNSNDPVQIVALTDPNDILGYRLDLSKFSQSLYKGFSATNVLVSNAGAFLGLVSNPMKAHQGPGRNQILGIIADGFEP